MSGFFFLACLLFCALPLGIGIWIGFCYAPSDAPEPHPHCSECLRSIDHLNARHRASAPRGPFNKSDTKGGI